MSEFNLGDLGNALNENGSGVSFKGRSQHWEDAEKVKELVDEINKCKELIYLDLEGNTLGVDAAVEIGEALKKHPEIKKALWKDLFTGRLKTEIPKALECLGKGMIAAGAKLSILDCSDNALGPNGMEGLVKLLRSPTCYSLQELKLNNCGLGITGGKMLADALLSCYKSSCEAGTPFSLKVFIAGRNRLENEGAKALSKVFAAVKTLEMVSMPQNGIYSDGIAALSDAFKLNVNMQVINLNDNTIRPTGAEHLAEALASMPKLKDLNFGDCLLKTKGAILLGEALSYGHEELEILNLSANEINADGGMCIVTALENKPNIQSVILDANMFGCEGREKIKSYMNKHVNAEALGSLSEDESECDDDEDEDRLNDNELDGEEEEEEEDEDDEGSDPEDDHYVETDEEPEDGNYVTALAEKSSNSWDETYLDTTGNDNKSIETTSVSAQTICESSFLTLDMLNNFHETNKLDSIRKYLNLFKDDEYLICLVYLILKFSSLAEQSKEALEIASEFYKEAFDFAQENKQIKRVVAFFLTHLDLIRCEDKSFKPKYNVKSCRFALQNALQKDIFPKNAHEMFDLFLNKFG